MPTEVFAAWDDVPRALAEKLHRALLKIEPSFTFARAWAGVGYKIHGKYSCVIAPYEGHIKLMIWRGTELRDPDRRLKGTGSNTRHLRFERGSEIKRAVVEPYLKEQHALYASGVSPEKKAKARPRAKRPPAFIRRELEGRGLLEAFKARPPYQRGDYVSWVESAKREATRERRLEQMLSELEAGDVYMRMPWSRKKRD